MWTYIFQDLFHSSPFMHSLDEFDMFGSGAFANSGGGSGGRTRRSKQQQSCRTVTQRIGNTVTTYTQCEHKGKVNLFFVAKMCRISANLCRLVTCCAHFTVSRFHTCLISWWIHPVLTYQNDCEIVWTFLSLESPVGFWRFAEILPTAGFIS